MQARAGSNGVGGVGPFPTDKGGARSLWCETVFRKETKTALKKHWPFLRHWLFVGSTVDRPIPVGAGENNTPFVY